jgi:hypothetical protein
LGVTITSNAGDDFSIASRCCHPKAISFDGSSALIRALHDVELRKAAHDMRAPSGDGGMIGIRRGERCKRQKKGGQDKLES